jgi:hypothetical protein
VSFPVTVIQTVSATAIFVAGYLGVFTVAVFILVLASCIYKGDRLMRAYGARAGSGRVIDRTSLVNCKLL